MNQELENLILATYADLCIAWRREVVSCRSNALDLNDKLSSLEEVMKAFKFAVPGLFDSQPASVPPEPVLESEPIAKPIAEPTTATYEARVFDDPSEQQASKARQTKPERKPAPKQARKAKPEAALSDA